MYSDPCLQERSAHWADLVDRIASGDKTAEDILCNEFRRGVSGFVRHALRGSAAVEDIVSDILIAAITSIRRSCLQDGRALPGYIRTIAQRQIAAEIRDIQRRRNECAVDAVSPISDHRPTPEQDHLNREREQLAVRVLASLPEKQQEVLRRFYLQEQSPEQICAEMDLTHTQFRLLKNRAKARFSQIGRKEVVAGRLRSVTGHFRRIAKAC